MNLSFFINTFVIMENTILLMQDIFNEAFPRAIAPQLSYFRSVQLIGTERFFTPPPMSKYVRHYGMEKFFTPPPMSTIRFYGRKVFHASPGRLHAVNI